MTRKYRLTPKAAADMRSINHYTARHWGQVQRRTYIGQLKNRLAWLADHPQLGKARPDIREGLHCFPEAEHIIFYRIETDGIEVVAVLHNRMLPETRL